MNKISYLFKLKRVKILNDHGATFQKEISSLPGFFFRNSSRNISKASFRIFLTDKNIQSDTQKKSLIAGLYFYILTDIFLSERMDRQCLKNHTIRNSGHRNKFNGI